MANKKFIHVAGMYALSLLFFFMVSGCGTSKPEPATTPVVQAPATATPAPEKKAALAQQPGPWKADGVIADNEYVKVQTVGEVEVYSRIDGDTLRLALKAKTNGFVAIGFDPAERMKDADIILGFVKDGKAVVADMYSTGVTGPHPPDDQQGGKNDVTVFGGSKKDGVTIIEFERKLVTGDSKDKIIKAGDNKIIWAVGEAEAATGKHVKRGNGILKL